MGKLEIKNINKIVGKYLPNGRWISEAGDYNTDAAIETDKYYYFLIHGDKNKDGQWDGEQTVVLRKFTGNQYSPNDPEAKGKYELFNMGLQVATNQYLTKSEINNPLLLIECIEAVINKTKQFFNNKNY